MLWSALLLFVSGMALVFPLLAAVVAGVPAIIVLALNGKWSVAGYAALALVAVPFVFLIWTGMGFLLPVLVPLAFIALVAIYSRPSRELVEAGQKMARAGRGHPR